MPGDLNNVQAISYPVSAEQPTILRPSSDYKSMDLKSSVLSDLNSSHVESIPPYNDQVAIPGVTVYKFGIYH